uniref:BZIP domain-containing protein n=1 Tax=Steinernema glaseri TaxID=37863 RepID=A0A1I7Z185_9BILA
MDSPTLRTPEFPDCLFEDGPELLDFGFPSGPSFHFSDQRPYDSSYAPYASSSLCAPPACSLDLSLLDDFDEAALEGLEFNADSWVDFLEGGDADLDRLLEADQGDAPSQAVDLSPTSDSLDVSILNEFFDGFGHEQAAPQSEVAPSAFDFPPTQPPMYGAAEPSTAPTTQPSLPEAKKVPEKDVSPSSSDQRESPSHYREMRDKNNAASQKSRMKRKLKFEALKEEAVVLEKRNAELRQLSEELEKQLETYKTMMMRMISK